MPKKQRKWRPAVFFVLTLKKRIFRIEWEAALWGKDCEAAIKRLSPKIETYGQVVRSGWRFISAATDKATYERIFKVKIRLCDGGWVRKDEQAEAEVPLVLTDWIKDVSLAVLGRTKMMVDIFIFAATSTRGFFVHVFI